MRSARLALLALSVALLGACGVSSVTGPQSPPQTDTAERCGYLGSSGCLQAAALPR